MAVGNSPVDPSTTSRILDRAAAIDRLGFEEELLEEFAQSLLQRSRGMLADIVVALERGDFAKVKALSHSVKGAAATLEANALAAAARRLEDLARDGELVQCRGAFWDLAAAVDELAVILTTE